MRYKRYPKYKDSGIEWIGEIPEGWSTKKLKYITRLLYGESLSEEMRQDGNIPVLGSNGQIGKHITANTQSPAIVVGRKGSFGKVTYSHNNCFAIDTTYFIDKTATKNNLRWLYYLLQTLKLDTLSQDTGVPGLNREHAYDNYAVYTLFDEQQSIATFLDRKTSQIDSLIADKQRLIELLEEKRSALITQAVTKGLDPNVPMKDSGIEWIGEIPEGWETVLLKHKFDVQLGKMLQPQASSPQDTLEPYLCAANIQWESADLSVIKHMWFSPKDKNNYLLRAGDLLVSEGGDVGRSCIWQAELPRVFFQNAINRVRSKGVASITFLYYWMYFVKHIGYIDVLCNKATIPHFTADKVQNLAILLPTPTEQLQITTFLDCKTSQIDSLITDIRHSITLLEEYKQSLITAAVTGKIDVRDEGSEQIA